MKQKTKKRLITGIIILIWLLGCYFIGQVTHPQAKTFYENVSSNSTSTEDYNEGTAEQELQNEEGNGSVPEETDVTFFDVQQLSTDDIPWGFNAGIIILEDGSEAWLLTPGASLTFNSIGDTILEYQIHPWMKEVSDGATLILSTETDQKVLDVTGDSQEFCTGVGYIKLELINSEKNDGDWVIIRQKNGDRKQ